MEGNISSVSWIEILHHIAHKPRKGLVIVPAISFSAELTILGANPMAACDYYPNDILLVLKVKRPYANQPRRSKATGLVERKR